LIKYKNQPLEIQNIFTNKTKKINDFKTPEAFIFIYEKELFLALGEGKITLYNCDGDIISDFGKETLYS
jgi:hypothetical protein